MPQKNPQNTTDFLPYVIYILKSIDSIDDAVAYGEQKFQSQSLFYHGVLRLLQTLSQSAAQLPDTIKQQHPEVNWKGFRAIRDTLLYKYLNYYHPDKIWQILVYDLPALEEAMSCYIPDSRKT